MHGRQHLTWIALIGWYLMLPQVGQQNGVPWPDSAAPISRWTIAESFDRAKPCETILADRRKKALRESGKVGTKASSARFWNRFYVTAAGEAVCIATNDPRLRDDAPTRLTGVQPFAAN
jgi:hypothetical protein